MNLSTWCLVVIYIGYWSSVNSLQWDIESTLELDSKESNIPKSLNGPRSELIYLVGMGYEDWIGSRFTFMHKGILVITQSWIGVCEQSLQIGLID